MTSLSITSPSGIWPGVMRAVAVLLALALLAYVLATGSYLLTPLGFALIYAVFVAGLNVFMGYAGQVSFGQNAFAAIGGYGSAVLTVSYAWEPVAAFLVSALAAALSALLIGVATLRLRGHYLAMATLAVGLISYEVSVQWESVTQGYNGISGIPPFSIGALEAGTDRQQFAVLCVAVAGSLFAMHRLRRSRFGRGAARHRRQRGGGGGPRCERGAAQAGRVRGVGRVRVGRRFDAGAFCRLRQPGDVRPAHGRARLHHAVCRRNRNRIRAADRRRGDQPAARDDPPAEGLPGFGLWRGVDRDPDPRAQRPRQPPPRCSAGERAGAARPDQTVRRADSRRRRHVHPAGDGDQRA